MIEINEIRNNVDKYKGAKDIQSSLEKILRDKKDYPETMEVDFDQETSRLVLEYLKAAMDPPVEKAVGQHMTPEEKKAYLYCITCCAKKISLQELRSSAILPSKKMILLEMRYGHKVTEDMILAADKKKCMVENVPVINLANDKFVQLMVTEIKDDVLVMEGFHYLESLGQRASLQLSAGKTVCEGEFTPWTLRDVLSPDGSIKYKAVRFRYEVPCVPGRTLSLSIVYDGHAIASKLLFGDFSHMANMHWTYFRQNGYIVSFRNRKFHISKATAWNTIKRELRFDGTLLKRRKINYIFLRWLSYFAKLFVKKPIWIFRDNEKRAKDSALEMFKYFSTWEERDKYKGYFIQDRRSEDYAIAKQYGKVLQPYNLKCILLILLADCFIDTRGSFNPRYLFADDKKYINGLCQWNYIWIIHGVMIRNNASWTNKFYINAKLFATSGLREYQSIIEPESGYGYDHGEVVLTGLPRHDAMKRSKKKMVLIMPTWRKSIAGELIHGTSDRVYNEDFKNTDFFAFYNGLINHPKLIETMEKTGYRTEFYLHPAFMKQWKDFDTNPYVTIGQGAANSNQLTGDCGVMVTDYSSTALDAAYLRKPVVYSQYDYDTFSERHTGKDGYFDYDIDGFGKVCHNLEETVAEIIRLMENDCQNDQLYIDRASEFFAFNDAENSKRVFEAMEKMKKEHKI